MKNKNLKVKAFHPIIKDENERRKKRLGELAKATGMQKQFLMSRIFDAGADVIERTIKS